MTDTADLARTFLATLEARDWDAWSALLADDVVYEMPQTRERITGRAAYLAFNQTFPGEWHLTPKVVIGDAHRAVAWFAFTSATRPVTDRCSSRWARTGWSRG